jgi:glycosyltransferase involved in cell wall biosynthesis
VAGHGGLVEIVDDKITGFVFQPGDAASLQSKLEVALNDTALCDDLRRDGREKAREKFSLEAHYQAVQRIYAP